MKHHSKLPLVTGLCAGLGLLCLFARQWLLRNAVDEKGLLIAGHPANLLCWLLLVAALCVLLPALRQRQLYHFAPTALSAVSMVFFAAGYGITAWQLLISRAQTLAVLAGILGCISALFAVFLAFAMCRKLRLHPFVYCPAVVFLLLFLICRYQQWSSEPELQRYLFQLLSVVTLMLTAYHRATLESDKKGVRSYLIYSRAAIFFCIAAIPGSLYGVLYGCSAVGLLLDGFTVRQGE